MTIPIGMTSIGVQAEVKHVLGGRGMVGVADGLEAAKSACIFGDRELDRILGQIRRDASNAGEESLGLVWGTGRGRL
jgi:hypothetical protein